MDCINWTGCKSGSGYGTRTVNGRSVTAHAAAWEEANGCQVPKGMVVMHSCANKLCVNPEHLSVGTQSENCREATARGVRWNQAVTQEEAELIRWCRKQGPRKGNYGWAKKTAAALGLYPGTVGRICRNETYLEVM
jgi:hypothetical protein